MSYVYFCFKDLILNADFLNIILFGTVVADYSMCNCGEFIFLY